MKHSVNHLLVLASAMVYSEAPTSFAEVDAMLKAVEEKTKARWAKLQSRTAVPGNFMEQPSHMRHEAGSFPLASASRLPREAGPALRLGERLDPRRRRDGVGLGERLAPRRRDPPATTAAPAPSTTTPAPMIGSNCSKCEASGCMHYIDCLTDNSSSEALCAHAPADCLTDQCRKCVASSSSISSNSSGGSHAYDKAMNDTLAEDSDRPRCPREGLRGKHEVGSHKAECGSAETEDGCTGTWEQSLDAFLCKWEGGAGGSCHRGDLCRPFFPDESFCMTNEDCYSLNCVDVDCSLGDVKCTSAQVAGNVTARQCLRKENGEQCTHARECHSDHCSVPAGGFKKVCHPVEVGEPCLRASDCLSGTCGRVCPGADDCGSTGPRYFNQTDCECQIMCLRSPVGQVCTADSYCRTNNCNAPAPASQTTAAPTSAPEATTCQPSPTGAPCQENEDCLSENCTAAPANYRPPGDANAQAVGVCQQNPIGHHCDEDADCISNHCDSDSGECAGNPKGAACRAGSDCLSGRCTAGACAGNEVGDSCVDPEDCLSQSCHDHLCKAGNGQPCQQDGDCVTGNCHDRLCAPTPGTLMGR